MTSVDPYASEIRELLGNAVEQFALLFAGEPDESVETALEIVNAQLSETLPDSIVELVLTIILKRKARIEQSAQCSDFEIQPRRLQ
jgi:hypothetical protein